MISFDEAVDRVAAAARPLGTEIVPLDVARGRVLAEPVIARIDSPRADVSAMDGYAVRDADLRKLPARLAVAGESFAGQGWDGELREGHCIRIFTGAPVPPRADRVLMQEDVRREGGTAVIARPAGDARHVRERGGDFRVGDQLLEKSRMLDSRAILAAAAADLAEVEVYLQPRLSILSTGDELAQPGRAAESPNAIPESVSFGVAALAREWGASVAGRQRLGDDLGGLHASAAEAVQRADVVVVTGGASVGEKDFAKAMFEPLGLELAFSKVAMKPGKPVWLGSVGGTHVMGLPGNPTSAMVTARLFLAPLLASLGGREVGAALRWRKAPLASPLAGCGPRETFHRARWDGDAVELLSFQDSSAQKALAQADVLVRQRAGAPGQARGDLAEVLDF